MAWRQFFSPQQEKLMNTEIITLGNMIKKSASKQDQAHSRQNSNRKHYTSDRKQTTNEQKPIQPQDSFSKLFFQQIAVTQQYPKYLHKQDTKQSALQTLKEIRNIQKQQLQCQKKLYRMLQQSLSFKKDRSKSKSKSKSTIKKKKANNLQEQVTTKIKQLEKLKVDLTDLLKRSRTEKTKRKHTVSAFR